MRDEDEVMRITNQYWNEFRENYVGRFKDEFKPLLREWRRFEKKIGLL